VRALVGAIKRLIQKFNTRFLACAIMDALGIVYPQYWLELNCDVSFGKHFLKATLCYGKT
jgi:hypothetical protein